MQVGEQTLKALGMEVCADLVANRGLINLLFSPVATDSFLSAGLGLGRTVHGQPPNEGEVNRKGISCERTFAAISSAADLESKVGAVFHQAEQPSNTTGDSTCLRLYAGQPYCKAALQS